MTDLPIQDDLAETVLITPQYAAERHAAGVLLVDVRREQRRIENGEIEGAIPVDRTEVTKLFGSDPDHRLAGVDSYDKEIVVFCSSENGSRPVVEKLVELGYRNVVHIAGGFAGWKEQGLPFIAPENR